MENTEYIASLEIKIIQAQSRIDSGIITSDKTLRITKNNIKAWEQSINELKKINSEST